LKAVFVTPYIAFFRQAASRPRVTPTGMANQWLATQEPWSVRNLWIKTHGYSCVSSCAPLSCAAWTRMPWWGKWKQAMRRNVEIDGFVFLQKDSGRPGFCP